MAPSRLRLALLPQFLLAALLVLLVTTLWSAVLERLQLERGRALEEGDAAALSIAQGYAQRDDRVFQQIEQITLYLKTAIEANPEPAAINQLLATSRASLPEFSLLYSVANAKGDMIAGTLPVTGVNIGDRLHFLVHTQASSDGLYLGQVVLGRVSGHWSLQASRRLNRKDGSFAGVLVVSISPDSLVNQADLELTGKRSLIALIGRDGLARGVKIGDEVHYDDQVDGGALISERAASARSAFELATPSDGVTRRFTIRPVGDFPMLIAVGFDPLERLADFEQRRRVYLSVAAIGTLAILIFVLMLMLQTRALRTSQATTRRAERDYRAAAEGSMDSFIILKAIHDKTGNVIDFECRDANQRAASALGLERQHLIGKRMRRDFPHIISEAILAAYIDGYLKNRTVEDEQMVVDQQAQPRWIRRQLVPIEDGIAMTSRNVTAARLAENAVRQSEERVRLITDNMPALIAHTDRDLVFTFVNQTHTAWFGVDSSTMVGMHLRDFYGNRVFREVRDEIDRVLAGERVGFERELITVDGPRQVQVTGVPHVDADGTVLGIYILMNDITALKLAEQRLWALAQFDSLTGLPNRHQFTERLERAFTKARREGTTFAVLFVDIDRFKSINDTLGHAIGDDVLKEVSTRLSGSLRSDDLVARLGGDEFVVIVDSVRPADEALFLARKIQHQLSPPLELRGAASFKVTASIGIALLREQDASASDLLKRADEALYQAKAAGRDTYRFVA